MRTLNCQVLEQLKVDGNDDSHHLSSDTLSLFSGEGKGPHGLKNLSKFIRLVSVRDRANIQPKFIDLKVVLHVRVYSFVLLYC